MQNIVPIAPVFVTKMIFWVAYRPPFDHRENGKTAVFGAVTSAEKSDISFPVPNQYNGTR